MVTQICSKCLTEKPLTLEFYYFKKYRNVFYRECKECFSIRNENQKLTKEQKEKYNIQKIKYYYDKYKGTESQKAAIKKAKINYYKNHPMQKIADALRSRTRIALKRKNLNKTSKFNQYLGCDLDTLKNHLEIQFKDDMSWNNYGKWHIDHIKPLSLAQTEEELYKLCHYTNLQPLWALDNIKKKDKY